MWKIFFWEMDLMNMDESVFTCKDLFHIHNNKHLCLKFAYIVLRFVDDKGGEIYELMLWTLMLCLHHQEIYELMLWLPNLHYAMFASCVKISRTCIVISRVDILPCDKMLQLINTWNVCVMISKAYIAILHVDIW